METSAVEAFSKKSDFFNKCNQASWHKCNQVFFCENSDFFQHLHPSLFDDRLTSGHLVWNIPEKISGTVWLLYLQFTCLKAEVVTMHFRLDDNHGAQSWVQFLIWRALAQLTNLKQLSPGNCFSWYFLIYYFFWLILKIFAGFSETNRDLLRADRHSGSSFVISKADTSNRSEVIGRAKILFTIKKNHLYNLEKSCPLKNLENNVNR